MKKDHNISTGSRVGAAKSATDDGNVTGPSNAGVFSRIRSRHPSPNSSGAATNTDTSWAKNYKITHRPDRLPPGDRRRPQIPSEEYLPEDKILQYLERMWKFNKQKRDEDEAAATSAGSSRSRSQDHWSVASETSQRHSGHDGRSSSGSRKHGQNPQTTSRSPIPGAKFSSYSPRIRERRGRPADSPVQFHQPMFSPGMEHCGVPTGSPVPYSTGSSDRWTIEIGLDHQNQKDSELALRLINTDQPRLPDLTFNSSPSTEQVSPLTPVDKSDRDIIPRKPRPVGPSAQQTCPMPLCGKSLLSTADRERNLCTGCRRVFSGPYFSSDADTDMARNRDASTVKAKPDVVCNVDSNNSNGDTSIDRVRSIRTMPSPLQRVNNSTRNRSLSISTQPNHQNKSERRLSGPLLEPKTFCPPSPKVTSPGMIKKSKAGSLSRRRLSRSSSSNGRASSSSLLRARVDKASVHKGSQATPSPALRLHAPNPNTMGRRGGYSRNRHQPTTQQHLDPTSTRRRSINTPTSPPVGRSSMHTMGQESKPGVESTAENENENIEQLIDEIIDFYLRRPDMSDSEHENRKAEALASYHSETPEMVKMSTDNWI